MLVLSRKKNESIVINDEIIVTVVDIRGDKARIGIVAPNDIPIHRQEVHIYINEAKLFRDHLMNKEYNNAYQILLRCTVYKSTPYELSELKAGLEKSGQLDENAKSKLEQYITEKQ